VTHPPPEAARHHKRHGLLTRFALTTLLVFLLILGYNAFVGFADSDPWMLAIVIPFGLILSFVVAGWITALVFVDPDTHER
jgi:hypothetical protein